MRNLLVLLTGLVAGSTCYAQTTNNFPASGDATVGNGNGIKVVNPDGKIGAKMWGNNSSVEGNSGPGYLQLFGSLLFDNGNNLHLSDGASVVNIHQNTAGSPINIKLNAVGASFFNGGRVGIGTSSPSSNLHVVGSGDGSAALTLQDQSNNTGVEMRSGNNGCQYLDFTPNSTGANSPDFGGRIIYNFPLDNGFTFYTNKTILSMAIDKNGSVGIGTSDSKGYKLAVAGKMVAEEVNVKLQSAWPDYVFKPAYKLPSLGEVKDYIDKNKHLPDMPSEQEVAKEGISLGEMNRLLVKKMEEMTLYMIKKDKEMQVLRKRLNKLESRNK